jgi:hypothetical protein
MNEDETTPEVDASVVTGVEETQPEEQIEETAVETTTETPEGQEEEPEQSDNSAEDDLSEWAAKKGIDLSTPEGQAKALKSMREAEKSFHTKAQQASELEKQLTAPANDPNASQAEQALAIATQLQNEKVIRNWKEANNVTPEEDAAMGEYAQKNPRAAELLTNGLLTLDEFRAIAVPAQKIDKDAIRNEGGQEALKKLANKQLATAVKGGASSAQTSTSLTKDNVEQWYASLGTEGRQNPQNQATLERILAS